MKVKNTLQYCVLVLGLFFSPAAIAQSPVCAPSATSVNADGDTISYFGGYVRQIKVISDDKSAYQMYLAQIDNGKKGTFLFCSFKEYIKEPEDYERAVSSYLNQNSLKNSTIQILLNGNTMSFQATSCTHTTKKSLGSVQSYQVLFTAHISKEQIKALQNHEITKFQFNVGGKPYETHFKNSNRTAQELRRAFTCLDISSVKEIAQKDASELDMSEVSKSEYAKAIVGKWVATVDGRNMQMNLSSDGSLEIVRIGYPTVTGTYKIAADRFIYTAGSQSGAGKISLFLKDMLIIEEKGEERTWTRIE